MICLVTKPEWKIQETEVASDADTGASVETETRAAETGSVPRVADMPIAPPKLHIGSRPASKAMLLCTNPVHDCSFATCWVALCHDLGAFDTDKTTHREPIGLAPSRGFPTTRPTHFQTVCCLAAVVLLLQKIKMKQQTGSYLFVVSS